MKTSDQSATSRVSHPTPNSPLGEKDAAFSSYQAACSLLTQYFSPGSEFAT